MQIVYLPGFSVHNKQELDHFVEFFEAESYPVFTYSWSHWVDESIEFNSDKEISAIEKELDTTDIDISNCIWVAKSIGTAISVEFFNKNSVYPKQLLLMGIPLSGLSEVEKTLYHHLFKNSTCPISIIQNEFDKYGGIEHIKAEFGKHTNVDFISIENNETHKYMIADKVESLIK